MLASLLMSAPLPGDIELIGSTKAQPTSEVTEFDIALPAGAMSGDLMLLASFANGLDHLGAFADTANFPNPLASGTYLGFSYGVFYGFVSETTPDIFTLLELGTPNSKWGSAALLVFRNAAVDTYITTTSAPAAPSLTVSEDDSYIVGCYGRNSTSVTCGTPSGMTAIQTDNDVYRPSFKIAGQAVDAGSTGTKTSTNSDVGVLVALKKRYG